MYMYCVRAQAHVGAGNATHDGDSNARDDRDGNARDDGDGNARDKATEVVDAGGRQPRHLYDLPR